MEGGPEPAGNPRMADAVLGVAEPPYGAGQFSFAARRRARLPSRAEPGNVAIFNASLSFLPEKGA